MLGTPKSGAARGVSRYAKIAARLDFLKTGVARGKLRNARLQGMIARLDFPKSGVARGKPRNAKR